ncbi:NYN domain-containing protein [Candidatus Woesebacteria bacterium]|nr:NYN domain-containing protein [Candidatus Woesebacteria bacterium]
MKKKADKLNNYAFIDSQNLNLGVRDQGWKLDFARFRVYLKDKYKVKKAFLFIGYIQENQKLYGFLKKVGYVLIFKPVLLSGKKDVKGNVDAELVLHSMIEFSNYTGAVIVTGDGDFHCLVEYLEDKGKLVGLIVPNKFKYSALLREFADYIDFLNLQRENLKIKKRHNP